MQVTVRAATFLRAAANELGFSTSARAAAGLDGVLQTLPSPTPRGFFLAERSLTELMGALDYLLRTFHDELDGRPLFIGSHRSAELVDTAAAPFGESVQDAFPTSAEDLTEATHCLGAGRGTASVMHLMRALETPLVLLAGRCGVEAGENWNTLLNRIEASFRDRTATRDPDWEQWAAEAATHFRFIKNAWRNHAMHARTAFSEQAAAEVYRSVGAFLRHLATRLSES
jgi:hypothetical protein